MAYIEPTIETLVHNELMKRIGNKVYTDFIIYSHYEVAKSIPPQRQFIEDNFIEFWKQIQSGLDKVKQLTFYNKLSDRKRAKLEYYFLMYTLAKCFFGTGSKIYDNKHDFPERPNGGKWIAMGHSNPKHFDHENAEFHKYSWSGERANYLNNTLGAKEICLRVFDTPLESKRYYHTKYNLNDDSIAQMLYIISENIAPPETGVNLLYFENIPYLVECGVLDNSNGKPTVDIPILTGSEFDELNKITFEVADEFIPICLSPLSEHLNHSKVRLPKHLKSVPEQKQYLTAMNCLNMFMIYKAKDKGFILNRVDFPCPPMVLVVIK